MSALTFEQASTQVLEAARKWQAYAEATDGVKAMYADAIDMVAAGREPGTSRMTLDEWVQTCKSEGWDPVLTAVRQSPSGKNHSPPLVGIDPTWLATRFKGAEGIAKFRRLLAETWRLECEAFGAMPKVEP